MRPALLLVVLLTSLYMVAADSGPNASTLDRWVGGKWTADGQFVDTDNSKAMKVRAVNTCVWSPDHVFVICDQAVTANDKPSRQLSIYGYDPDSGKFHFFGMSPSEDTARSPALTITEGGNRWEYSSSDTVKGKLVKFRTVNIFRDADHVDWWTDYSSDDGAHWTKMGGGTEVRQK